MIIRDAIHGNVELGGLEGRIMDTAEFQRLRGIKQLGMTHLVYPGAMHTRFEHSIGTMHLASLICERLGASGEEKAKMRVQALLHDIGHNAFSHESEKAIRKFFGSHEEIGKEKIAKGEIGDIIRENFSVSEIAGDAGEIICSDVGADRMDYLHRDAYYTGVSYGTVDTDRVIHTLEMDDGGLVVGKRGLEAAEMLLVGRFMMFSNVYLHKTVRIASAMLNKGISGAISEGMEPEAFLEGTDDSVLRMMRETPSGEKYAGALLRRELYKEAHSVEGVIVDPETAAKELSDECSCDVLVDLPPVLSKKPRIRARVNGKLGLLVDESDLVRSLFMAEEKRKRTLILCPKGEREKVHKSAKAYFR
ncbi:HD domain-containing protein [Candidatus Micrarchaeota archaeon]|nr:HD domain-containing protein [Candidatus Micrarchaeota archaeon]